MEIGLLTVNIEEKLLCKSFHQKNPNYIIIITDNFLCDVYAQDVYDKYPLDFANPDWHKYENPLEVKYANTQIIIYSIFILYPIYKKIYRKNENHYWNSQSRV